MDLANATYEGVYDRPVTLADGRYEGEPFQPGAASRPVLVLLPDLTASGDLDGDGTDEGIGILVENSGGSGSFVYLAVVGPTPNGDRSLATKLLGDRVNVTRLTVEDATIEIELVAPDPDGPMAGPGRETFRQFRLYGAELVEPPQLERPGL